MSEKKAFIVIDLVSDLCFEKNRSNTYTARAFREYMEEQKMRDKLKALGVQYVAG
ncbi:MAG: hypothetical protein K6C38_05000 [Saccharofermentans sp.]|nr:hypothetical protein [Saccharofermentans sp.]